MSNTLFPTPPRALLDDIEHMHYAWALIIWLLPHSRPSHFLLLWLPKKLNDDDVGVACLSSMHRQVMEHGAGNKMSHAARWAVCQSRKSREMEATNGLCASMCVYASVAGYVVHTTLKIIWWVIWTLFVALRAIISCFIVEGVMQSIVDMLKGYIDFLICHVGKTTFKTAPRGYLDGFQ
jgi:hypothetical protein